MTILGHISKASRLNKRKCSIFNDSTSGNKRQLSNDSGENDQRRTHKPFDKNLLVVNETTRKIVEDLQREKNADAKFELSMKFQKHLLKNPDTRLTADHLHAVKQIQELARNTENTHKLEELRITAALLGSVPDQERGIRILTIDGGGSRGVVAIEMLRQLTKLADKPIHELFDYICGVSTGGILAWMLGLKLESIEEAERSYREFSSKIFGTQNRFIGTGKLMLSHSYYDTYSYQQVLKDLFGEKLLIETAANEKVPKCCAVSTLVNRHVLKPYVWRNYSIVSGAFDTHWPGTCRAKMWEAIYASSAAPGYFEEFKYGQDIHQDGGILTNNPAGVALNECRLLWPKSSIECLVSVGTGRYDPFLGPNSTDFLSLKNKLLKIIDSATETNEVHNILYELLPKKSYFRFNPFISEPIWLDECNPKKLDLLVTDARKYVQNNKYKFRKCVEKLST